MHERSPRLWTFVTVAVTLPFLLILSVTIWRTPFPLSEAVALFEDVAQRPAASFLTPSSSYYRPLFHLALSGLWNDAPSVAAALASIKLLLHIAPLVALMLLFIWHLRPRTAIDAGAAAFAVAVLIGSPGLLGNLELPLSYTIVGMPAALAVWMLLERDDARWHGAAIVALTLLAIGFKEQGLVIVPLVIVAWWMRAPGARPATTAIVTAIAVAYAGFRIWYIPDDAPLFEQEIGFGFGSLSTSDAEARFGDFPLWIYAYNSASTISNALFAEPTEGVFRIVRAIRSGQTEPWHVLYLASSLLLTALILWWGISAVSQPGDRRWSPESRALVALMVALAASGALSFNYSRDRLAGMAVPFYALAAYYAARWAAVRASSRPGGERRKAVPGPLTAAAALVLLLLGGAWQMRAMYTIEFSRQRAVNTQREWLTHLGRRRVEFAGRRVYLDIMNAMIDQGTAPHGVQRTQYPRWLVRLLGEY